MPKAFILLAAICISCIVLTAGVRLTPLENFDSGSVTLQSWADEDLQPNNWTLDPDTPDGSPYSLKLSGNCWKLQPITPFAIDSVGVMQVKVKTNPGTTSNVAKVQGIGFTDGVHQIFYSFSGSRVVDIEAWVPVYQGAFSHGQWNTIQLPLASDWQAFWGYLPVLSGIIYINDLDEVSTTRTVFFDVIEDISTDLPVAPRVSISYSIPTRDTAVQFSSTVLDPDSNQFSYEWDFGDSTFSAIANPYHLYTQQSDRPYTATLKVIDDTGKYGLASVQVTLETGTGNMPVTMNFVGDIMLARRYESAGGIIPTQGVNAIFTPTKPYFGDAAEINVANLEVVLSNVGTPHPTKSVVYRGSPSNISGLVYAGIDVVSSANNHTLDYGLSALQQMQGLLDTAGIIHSGSGANSYEAYTPSFINRRGLNLAFLRSCDRTGQYNNAQPYLQAGYSKPGFAYMTPYYIQQQLEAVEGIADLKIVEMHGGSEYSLTPGSGYDKGNPYQDDIQDEDYFYRNDVPHQWDIDIRHSAIDSGADLVIVHHPHIIHGMEVYQNKLIAHSLGNFVFDLDYPETMPTIILYADAYPEGFQNFKVKPFYIDNYIPKPATGQLGTYILDYLARRSRDLNTRLWVDRENMEAKVLMNEDNPAITSSSFSINKNLVNHASGYNLSDPFKLPRRGSISEITATEPIGEMQFRLGRESIWYGNFEDEGSSLWSPSSYETESPFDGQRSAKLSANATYITSSTIPKKCKWYDNTVKHTLHGWVKTENASYANIVIRYYSSRTSGASIGSENICDGILGSSDWTYYHKELTIPANAYYYDIRITLTAGTSAATAWFDNVGLIEWTDWSDASALVEIAWPNDFYYLQGRSSSPIKSFSVSLAEKSFDPDLRAAPIQVSAAKPTLQISPNPFNPDTIIYCNLPEAAETEINIYNLKGQLVKHLAKEQLSAGKHRFAWDGRDTNQRPVASGVYFFRVSALGRSSIHKAVLLK